jgi:hypothetical protein
MASVLYPYFKQGLLGGSVNMIAGTVKAALVDTGTYTYSASHDYYNDVSGVVGTPVALASKTFDNGVFDAADTTFTSVTGASVEAVVIYLEYGTTATSPLIAYIDTGTGLPVTPNGGNITVAWDNGASKIFSL